MTTPLITLDRISRIYQTGRFEVRALDGLDLTVERGEFLAIVGPSGSGKSTLMNIVGCLDRPTSGRYLLAGTDVSGRDKVALARIRNRTLGFVFQSYNLLPRTSALDNVAMALAYQGVGRKERLARASASLERLGLGDRMDHEPTELSGGQQQRVAIARALANNPSVLLADEPTGNLDSKTGLQIVELLSRLSRERGVTVISATHDHSMLAVSDRVVYLRDGRVDRILHRSELQINVGSIQA